MSTFDSAAAGMSMALFATFGEAVTFTPGAGAPESVTAVLSRPTRLSDEWPGSYLGAEFKIADLSRAPQRGDTVTVGAVAYTVFEVEEVPFMSTVRVTLEKKP